MSRFFQQGAKLFSRVNTPLARKTVAACGVAGASTFALSQAAVADSQSVDYAKVRKDIASILDQEGYDDGSLGPVFIRLGWHASGTYNVNDGSGGSNGATMRFDPEASHGANAGLGIARDILESVKKDHPGISYGDLWTLASIVAVEEMGGPQIPWRPGRTDKPDGSHCTPDGRLPDATQGAQHLRDIFYRMGMNDQEIVALSGAHTLGRCHTDRSGFTGPWTFAPTTFSNLYFQELLNRKWVKKPWAGPEQFMNDDADTQGEIMMLPTDLCLLSDPSFRKWVDIYAADEARFFKDFSSAYCKLTEAGVPFEAGFSWSPFVIMGGLVGFATKYGM